VTPAATRTELFTDEYPVLGHSQMLARRKARDYMRFGTRRTVLFLIAGKLDLSSINPHAS
jgi:hypothetical protein